MRAGPFGRWLDLRRERTLGSPTIPFGAKRVPSGEWGGGGRARKQVEALAIARTPCVWWWPKRDHPTPPRRWRRGHAPWMTEFDWAAPSVLDSSIRRLEGCPSTREVPLAHRLEGVRWMRWAGKNRWKTKTDHRHGLADRHRCAPRRLCRHSPMRGFSWPGFQRHGARQIRGYPIPGRDSKVATQLDESAARKAEQLLSATRDLLAKDRDPKPEPPSGQPPVPASGRAPGRVGKATTQGVDKECD